LVLTAVNLEYGDIALKKDNKTGKYQKEVMKIFFDLRFSL
jgi:uncharacterized protein YwbE